MATLAPDGKTLATGGEDRLLKLWDMTTGQLCRVPMEHPSHLHAIEFSHDGRLIATGCIDHQVRVWDVETGTLVSSSIAAGYLSCVAWPADTRALLTGTTNSGATTAFDWKTGQRLFPEGSIAGLDNIRMDPRGRIAALGTSSNEVYLLNLEELRESRDGVLSNRTKCDSDPHREFLDHLTDDELVTWAELLSNRRMNAGGMTNNMTAAEWRDRWQSFPHRNRLPTAGFPPTTVKDPATVLH